MTAAPVLTAATPALVDECAWDVPSYRTIFGWPVERRAGGAVLVFGQGLVALAASVPAGMRALERLELLGVEGPVVAVGGHRPYWAFLADPNEDVRSRADLPRGVDLLGCGEALPLPVRGGPPSGARWVAPPDRRTWLPTLGAVLLGFRPSPWQW